MPSRILASALLLMPLVLGDPAPAHANEVCESKPSSRGAVSLIILSSGRKVHELAGSVKDAQVVAKDGETVVFADGRVITSDPEAAGVHLNRLGWSRRRIDVTATFPAKRARPRRARG
jgi:hypothetical protein